MSGMMVDIFNCTTLNRVETCTNLQGNTLQICVVLNLFNVANCDTNLEIKDTVFTTQQNVNVY